MQANVADVKNWYIWVKSVQKFLMLFFKLTLGGDTEGNFTVMCMFIILTVVRFHKYICVSKLIEEHSKYVQQMNVSYASMKQFLKNIHAQPFEGFSLHELSHKSISTHLEPRGPLAPLLHFSPFRPTVLKNSLCCLSLPSSLFLFILLLLPGKGGVGFELTWPRLNSHLYPVTHSVGSPAPSLRNRD